METTQDAIVHVTPLAFQKIKQLLAEQGLSAIRLSVLGGGCAG